MAIVKVFKYEHFDPKKEAYVTSEGYATRPRIVKQNQEILRTGGKQWRLLPNEFLQVEEKMTSDGLYRKKT